MVCPSLDFDHLAPVITLNMPIRALARAINDCFVQLFERSVGNATKVRISGTDARRSVARNASHPARRRQAIAGPAIACRVAEWLVDAGKRHDVIDLYYLSGEHVVRSLTSRVAHSRFSQPLTSTDRLSGPKHVSGTATIETAMPSKWLGLPGRTRLPCSPFHRASSRGMELMLRRCYVIFV